MAIIYKPLFEVKLLHEYFLTKPRGESIFDLDQQQDRLNFLRDEYRLGELSVNTMIDYKIPDILSAVMQSQYLRLLPTYHGFRVVMRVSVIKPGTGNTIRYLPFVPLPPDLNIIICLNKKIGAFEDITNSVINNAFPAQFYFSNANAAGVKTFPQLTVPVAPFTAGRVYEQGELYASDTGGIREFFMDDAGNNQWRDLKGSGFVSSNDRLLVPLKFDYAFPASVNITTADFTLKDSAGNEVKSFSFSDGPFKKLTLDFRSLALNILPDDKSAGKLLYTLEVSGNSGFSVSHPLIFINSGITDTNTWGLVNIQPMAGAVDYSLLDDDGFLKTRSDTATGPFGTPVFEIRLTSRLSYWRYSNDKQKKLKVSAGTTDFVTPDNGRLLTLKPRPATADLTLFKKESDNSFHYLPNPAPGDHMHLENQQLISEIFVPESGLFPVV